MSAANHAALRPFGAVASFFQLVSGARRFEQLFQLTDAELDARGLNRQALVRSYINGLTHN